MRINILIITIIIGWLTTGAQEMADTVLNIQRADSVIIEELPDCISITVVDTTDASKRLNIRQSYPSERIVKTHKSNRVIRKINDISEKRKEDHWSAICGGLGLGLTTAINAPSDMHVPLGKSFEIQWLYVLGARYSIPGTWSSINFGVGLNYKNYKMTSDRLFTENDGKLVIGRYSENAIPKSSRIDVWSLTLPLLWRINLPVKMYGPGNMSLVLGAIGSYNMSGSIHNKWIDEEGNSIKQTLDRSYVRRLSYEIIGAVYVNNWLGIYGKYSPMKVLKDNAPSFRSLSLGLMVSF